MLSLAALLALFILAELAYHLASSRSSADEDELPNPRGRQVIRWTSPENGELLRVRRKPYYRPIHFYLRLFGLFSRLRGREAFDDWRYHKATTQGRDVYLMDDGEAASLALLIHEAKHVEQARRDGLVTYSWRYATRPIYRAEYELEAYGPVIRRAFDARGSLGAQTAAYAIVDDLRENYFVDRDREYLYGRAIWWAGLRPCTRPGCGDRLVKMAIGAD